MQVYIYLVFKTSRVKVIIFRFYLDIHFYEHRKKKEKKKEGSSRLMVQLTMGHEAVRLASAYIPT